MKFAATDLTDLTDLFLKLPKISNMRYRGDEICCDRPDRPDRPFLKLSKYRNIEHDRGDVEAPDSIEESKSKIRDSRFSDLLTVRYPFWLSQTVIDQIGIEILADCIV